MIAIGIILYLFFSLAIVAKLGRRFDNNGCPPTVLFLLWPIALPAAGLFSVIFWTYDVIDNFLREIIIK